MHNLYAEWPSKHAKSYSWNELVYLLVVESFVSTRNNTRKIIFPIAISSIAIYCTYHNMLYCWRCSTYSLFFSYYTLGTNRQVYFSEHFQPKDGIFYTMCKDGVFGSVRSSWTYLYYRYLIIVRPSWCSILYLGVPILNIRTCIKYFDYCKMVFLIYFEHLMRLYYTYYSVFLSLPIVEY